MAESDIKINPDLQKERDSATIDTEELACLLHGGKDALTKRRKLEDKVFSDPDYKCIPLAFLSREEQYEEGMRRSTIAVSKKDSLNDLIENHEDLMAYNSVVKSMGLTPFDLNDSMFKPTLVKLATKEQQEKWLHPAIDLKISGTYAQTELGHGTFLRGLETTAHYDPHTQEFVLNSPTISSTKWWPGALGKTSTHAVVMAQLYTLGKCHGVHPFVVQLRSLEDHKPLPGITVGDIGPKFGYAANDNGYLRLNNHRIPRDHMLMKYSQVAPDGTYTHPPKANLTYGTMTFVRTMIVRGASANLSKGLTIAVRYSAVRRQSEMRPGEPEPQIMDYPTQQYKLFPLIAAAYAFHFAQVAMLETYAVVTELVNRGDFSRNPELHALSSGLKAFTTAVVNTGLEQLRLSCGGHGYSAASGFPELYTDNTPTCTYEGENTVLLLQTARYLVKCVFDAKSGATLPGFVHYLDKEKPVRAYNRRLTDLDLLEDVFQERAYKKVHFAAEKVEKLMKSGSDRVGALNANALLLVEAANAHCHYFIMRNMAEKMKVLSISTELRRVLNQLGLLYALDGIMQNSGDFLVDGILSGEEVKTVQQLLMDLLPQIRVNAVALVDAFSFRDEALHSVLGRYDGNVYENLFKWAQNSPLNKTEVHSSYHKYLGPFLKRNRSKL